MLTPLVTCRLIKCCVTSFKPGSVSDAGGCLILSRIIIMHFIMTYHAQIEGRAHQHTSYSNMGGSLNHQSQPTKPNGPSNTAITPPTDQQQQPSEPPSSHLCSASLLPLLLHPPLGRNISGRLADLAQVVKAHAGQGHHLSWLASTLMSISTCPGPIGTMTASTSPGACWRITKSSER